jgi:hypothetical protein
MPRNDDVVVGSAVYSIAASVHPCIRVLAGPGAGKSFAMKRRVAHQPMTFLKLSLTITRFPQNYPQSGRDRREASEFAIQ